VSGKIPHPFQKVSFSGVMRVNHKITKSINLNVFNYINNVNLTRAYKFRIYPDDKRQSEIDERLVLAQQFYNKILEKAIASYKDGKTKVSMAQFNRFEKEIIKEDKKYLKIYSQTRSEIKYRLLRAFLHFFRRCREKKNGKKQKAGFPRFKSIDRYKSLAYPQDNGSFKIERIKKNYRLRVSRIGTMKIELYREIEGKIKTLTIKREAGKYYAIFTTVIEKTIPKVKNTNPIGIDVGLKTFAVLSDGTKIIKPNFRKNEEKHIARWQRIMARRVKGSKRRQKAKERLNKEYQKTNNQTNDFLHKITNNLVNSNYTSFAIEKLQIKNMEKNHLFAKAINYASWNKFFQLLSYKAESAGKKVIEVDPKNTSKICSNCGNVQTMPLSKRIYVCEVCGMQEDRDINASKNILKKATDGQSESYAQGDSVRPQHEAVVDELRTYSATNGCRGSPHALAVGGCHDFKTSFYNILLIT
jgi:putative transposase